MSVMHDVLWRVRDPKSCWMAPDPNTNHWKPDIELLKVHYGEKSPLIERALQRKIPPDQGSIPEPLGLWAGAVGFRHSSTHGYNFIVVVHCYSILTIYCVLPCMSVMHDVLWRVMDPISRWMAPDLNTKHWKRDIEILKVHYREKSPLIKDRSRGPQVSGRVLWGPVILASRHSSTRGYHFFVVVFILNTHYLLCPTLYECDA